MTQERYSGGPKRPEGIPSVDPMQFLANVMAKTRFREKGEPLRVLDDLVGFVRGLPDGTAESYMDKLIKEERRSGHPEAASYGEAEIDGQKFVLFGMHWKFFRGSFGTVVGEKFVEATEYAIKRKLPLVAIYSSAGARQQENMAALFQMPRMIYAMEEYRRRAHDLHLPYISVLCETWGGLSASVAFGDVTIGVRETSFGFSGPKVIISYTGKKPREGAQSVEERYRDRHIDYLVSNEEELVAWLGQFLKVGGNNRKNTEEDLHGLPPLMDQYVVQRRIDGTQGFASMFTDGPVGEADGSLPESNRKGEKFTLLERSLQLMRDPRRPDTEDILRLAVSDVVPLYLRWKLPGENMLHYPAIIAAIGKIGRQSYLFIGNQPSYYRVDNTIYKRSATPGPADFKYLKRMYALGQRLGLDCIVFTATFGALPTEEAERDNVSLGIVEATIAGQNYNGPNITIVLDTLGSGGGLATAPLGDHFAMLENAHAYVAEPRSAATILFGEDPSQEQIEAAVDGMGVTADDQRKFGLDDIILEPRGGAETNPTRAIEEIRNHIVTVLIKLDSLPKKELMRRRRKRLLGLRGMPLKREK